MNVDWTKMTDAEVFECLKSAPALVAGPWEETVDDDVRYWTRERTDGSSVAFVVLQDEEEIATPGWLATIRGTLDSEETFSTIEDAKTKVDDVLRKAGWRLA